MKKYILNSLIVSFLMTMSFSANAQTYNLTNGTYNTCSGNFYDAGGANGNYSDNELYVETFCANNGGNMKAAFSSFQIEGYYDSLYIFDGPTVNSNLIGTYTGNNSPGTVTSTGSCLTFRFKSDGSVVYSGFAATLQCTAPVVPVISFTSNVSTGCAPLAVNFTNTSTGCANFYWDLGDGNNSYNTNVSNTYYNSGQNYYVTLYAYGINWNYLGSSTMIVSTLYNYNYFNTSSQACPNTNVNFQYYGYSPTYSWNFGDGGTSNQQYASHTFAATGLYNVTLTIAGDCPQTISQVININNSVPANANFNSYFPSGSSCPGSPVNFYTNEPAVSYLWDFGDGNTATSQGGTQHSYATAGTYNVNLTVTNACGNSATGTNQVVINNTSSFPPALAINTNGGEICPGGSASFNVDYGYAQYVWNFGDGTPSINLGQNGSGANHSFLSAGNFNITATITDFCGNDTSITRVYTVSNNAAVTYANIGGSTQACPNSTTQFYAAGGYDHYTWDFGDGSAPLNAGSYLNHTFAQAGTYTVSVTIFNSCGGDSLVSTSINIVNNLPVTGASLNAYPQTLCPNESVNFNGNPYDAANFVWNFGDGSDSIVTSLAYGINHSYATPGTYTGSLHVTNACGADTIVYTTVNITTNNPVQNVYLNTPKTSYCLNEPVNISSGGMAGGSSNYINVYNYGDGSATDSVLNSNTNISHTYPTAGTYIISDHMYNSCGNDTILYRTITVSNTITTINQPYVSISSNTVCPGGSINFNTSPEFLTYSWNFGDSATSQGTSYANHTYTTLGNYIPTLTVTNYCGADSTFTLAPILVSNLSPVSEFVYISASPYNACPNDQITFSVSQGYASYIWNFGDGNIDTTTSSTITHSYSSTGNFNVSCRVINQCGNYKNVYSIITISNSSTIPQLQIETRTNNFCINDNVDFDITLLYFMGGGNNNFNSSYTYNWNFGDGQTALTTGTGTTHNYAANGVYTVTAVITNACGTSVTLTKIVTINSSSAPHTNFFGTGGQTAIFCPGDVVLFVASGTSSNNVVNFGDGNSATMTEQIINEEGHLIYIIRHAYTNNGQYQVSLTSTNGCGLTSVNSLSISVGNNNLPVQGGIYVSSSSTGILTTCSPVTIIGIGGASYVWNFGDGQTSNSTSPIVNHIYSNAGSYLISCIITNGCGNTATFTETLIITGGIGISASFVNTTSTTCNGGADGSVGVTVVGGQSPYSYNWSNGQTGNTATGLSAGSYSVTITDATGCAGNNTVTIGEPAAIDITVSTTATSCSANTGTATVSAVNGASGPYTYLWSNGNTTSAISNIGAGTYNVSVTANGCAGSRSFNISATGAPAITTNTLTNVTCYGGINGAIDVNITGGTAPYTYHWSNDSTTQDLTGLRAGTYNLTVNDASNCISVYSNTVNQGSAINVNVTVTRQADCGQFNGIAVASATGGTAPYTYAWASLGNNATQGSLPAGTYTVNATDAAGCSKSQQVTVNNANAPVVSAVITNVTCNGLANGSVNLSTIGGTGPYSYTWLNNGLHSYIQSNMAPGNYTIRVEDATHCEVYNQYTITQPTVLSVSAVATTANCGHNNGSVTSSVTGGTSPYIYNWSNSLHTAAITGLASAAYTLNVVDSKGCTASANAIVSEAAPAQAICVVSVDQDVNKNVIVWEKTTGQGVSAYNIYKESNVAGVYNILAQVPASDVSEFTDTASHPDQRSYRYKIQTVDSCSNNGAMSPFHKTIHLNVNLGVPVTNVNLIWEAYEGFNYGTYNIWRGTGLGNIAQIDQVPSSILSYTDVNAPTGADSLYYFIEMVSPDAGGCTSALRTMAGRNFNSGKSNTSGLRYADPTALVNTTSGNVVHMYPNPNNGEFTIDLSIIEKQQINVVVYDLRGRIVKTENFGNIDKGRVVKPINLTDMAKGVYMIQINTKQGVINNKIIID